jgi:hypothetical protein
LPVPGGPKNNIPFTGCQHESGTSVQWVINLHGICFHVKHLTLHILLLSPHITQYPAVPIILKIWRQQNHKVFIRAPS